MKPPMQPVCKGVNKKGELVWGLIPMPRWQQAMFPVKYVGDFLKFWMMRAFSDSTGYEDETPSLDLEKHFQRIKKHPRRHSGD